MSNKRNQWKMLAKMIAIVSEEFKDTVDRGGQPYIFHCLFVMRQVRQDDPEEMQMAVGHDLVEDSEGRWTLDRLREEGFSERVVSGIDVLTHKDGEDYLDVYIPRIALREDTARCKMGDLKHNSDISRLKDVRKKDYDRFKKYSLAYKYLSN